MTKRLYLTNAAADYTPTTVRGGWADAASTIARRMSGGRNVPAGQQTISRAETSTTSPFRVLLARFISDPITVPQTISGTISLVSAFLESNAAADMYFGAYVYVTAGSTDTVRGTLLTAVTGGVEFGTAATGVGANGVTLSSSVAVSAGDRIVVEFGYVAQNTVATSYTGSIIVGGTSEADIVIGDTGTNTSRLGWVEFSSMPEGSFGTIITPTGIASGQSIPAPTVKGQYTLKPVGIVSAETVPAPKVVHVLKPVAIASSQAMGTPTVRGKWYVRQRGIPSEEAFGQEAAVFLRGVVGKVLSREAFGTPKLLPVQVLQPKSVESSEDVRPVMYIQPKKPPELEA